MMTTTIYDKQITNIRTNMYIYIYIYTHYIYVSIILLIPIKHINVYY